MKAPIRPQPHWFVGRDNPLPAQRMRLMVIGQLVPVDWLTYEDAATGQRYRVVDAKVFHFPEADHADQEPKTT